MNHPSDEELAAIVAAIEVAWPRPATPAEAPSDPTANRWRFSGRWWARPMPGRGGGGKRWRSS